MLPMAILGSFCYCGSRVTAWRTPVSPLNALNNVLVELFMSNGPVMDFDIGFDIGIVLQCTRLDVAQNKLPHFHGPIPSDFH